MCGKMTCRMRKQSGVEVVMATLLGTLMVFTHAVAAKPSSFSQSSFMSMGGENSMSAAESRATADGVTKGECVYTKSSGITVKVTYTEDTDGSVTAETNDPSITDTNAELTKCRQAVSSIGGEVEEDLKKHQEMFEQQREKIGSYQEEFQKHQESFRKEIKQLQEQIREEQRRIMESVSRQHEELLQQQKDLFDNLQNIPF
ncbi:uncharacterized protein LOC121866787 isoform X1 [Homarus americanus]|uniref:uncharacterized protein LOC121866787 isoform X1 n=2 Tax=Homarus americanus TaxID=6706 RepID=UPI001C47F82C|nr:uncharacterized protein LOC121866787 isoform X1 [Homarus americanus]